MFYEVSSANRFEGAQSLLLDDTNTVRALGLESEPIPVTPGTNYSASAMMNIERGVVGLYLLYYNASGVRVGEASAWLETTGGEWKKHGASGLAPTTAAYARILIYSSGAGIGRGYADAVALEEMEIGTFERIGGVVQGIINADSDIGFEDGKHVIYSVFKGRDEVPTVFAVMDALTRDVLRTYPLPGVESAWGVKAATDGRVYIGTHYDGRLYRYTPGTLEFENLGRFGTETHVFSMTAGPDGKMYAGTYPSGKLYVFDPATEDIVDLGVVEAGQRYVRSLAYDAERDALYAGAGGTLSRIYKYSPDGTRKEILGGLIPGGGDTYAFPYGMDFDEDRLFVKFSNGDLLVVKPDDTIDYYDPNGMDIHSGQVAPIPGQPGRALFTLGGQLYAYDSATQSSTLIKQLESTTNFQDGEFIDLGSPDWPGLTFVGMGSYGHVIYYNLETGHAEVAPANYGGAPILIQSIHAGPDNKMYVAGYMSGFASYDPATGEVSESNPLGQIESSVVRGGKLILGAYAGARILEYDPALPFSKTNPRELFNLRGQGQDRPFAMAYDPANDRLAVGTVPNTTSLQGALATYDFATGELNVYENIVPNQSVISLTFKDGLLYAGTTVYGGLGTSGPTETNAKLFVFDPATKRKVFETIPATGRKGVTGLTVGPDGNVWGVAEDYIFKLNPDTRRFDYRAAKLRRYGSSTTWAWAFLHPGEDGNLYGTSRGQFFMVKPETNEYVLLDGSKGNYLNRDAFGSFYFSDSSELWKYTPPGSDREPPVTSAAVDPAEPDGSNGWYQGPATVTLHAADEQSSVTETVYSIDSGSTWSAYTAPVSFGQDGLYTMLYRSVDAKGNREAAKRLELRKDAAAPNIAVEIEPEAVYETSGEITIAVAVSDSASGVEPASVSVSLNGEPIRPGDVIPLYALPVGAHTVSVTASDVAGNSKQEQVVFHTAASPASLLELIDRFLAGGRIDNAGIAESLRAKAHAGSWQALMMEAQALSGKRIHPEAADALLRNAEVLMNRE
ncbi:OmpL47-type beta-barrel domain-containing protein [Paenibacillus sp.]|uniref:OmpL47-type beta-barrel domain-containing protein n=1 Tax=Paenibacillus sp. TaxID=58172 RepID=UPI0028113511|nr:hypothetical protein [Paenibacillus sp.]